MKKLIALVLAALMIASLAAATVIMSGAEEEGLPMHLPTQYDPIWKNDVKNVAGTVFQHSFGNDFKGHTKVTDGNIGNNKSGNIDNDYANKTYKINDENHKCWDGIDPSIAESYLAGTTVNKETLDLTKSTVKFTDGTSYAYNYYLDVTVKDDATADISGLCFYLQGYKMGVMDHAFDILVSRDLGATWTKVLSVSDPFNPNAQYHYENFKADADFGASGSEADAPAYIFIDFENDTQIGKQTGITDVAYACVTPRCNNGHYVARFTEMEIYGNIVTSGDDTTAEDTTAEAGDDTTVAEGDDTTAEAGDDTTPAPADNTTAAQDTTNAPTKTAAPTTDAPKESKGCGSVSVAAFAAAIIAALGMAVAFKKH